MSEHSHSHDHADSHHRPDDISGLTDRLRETSLKITGPRQAILETLRKNSHPLTNKQIHESLPEGMCDLATVYRSMHTLIKLGMVSKFDFGDGTARFELACCDEHDHHHHLVCTECSKVVEIDECFQEELEKSIAQRHGFKAVTHKLEFFGVCPDCQESKS